MTGDKTGTLILIEKLLRRLFLWFACRHHIGELLLKEACLTCFKVKGASTSPEVAFLKDFKQQWATIGNLFYLKF